MRQDIDPQAGEQLLHAVERIMDSPETILALVKKKRAVTGAWDEPDVVAPKLIAHYGNMSALIGAATALPAILPGIGTAATLIGAPLADMVLLLKFECELCLALSALRGNDIGKPEERQLALLLAAVQTTEAQGRRSALSDALEVSGTAIWNYAPRRVAKLLLRAFTILAAVHYARSLLRVVPVLGVAIGASTNKVLTHRVGKLAYASLKSREKLMAVAP